MNARDTILSGWIFARPGTGPVGRVYSEATAAFILGAVLVTAVGGALGSGLALGAGLALFTLAGVGVALGLRVSYRRDAFGLCNTITLVRLALTCAIAVILLTPGPVAEAGLWTAFAAALVSLALDGVDGWAARRAGLVSRFGARFDMEVDSLMALVLALVAFDTGKAGLWVLALGLPRYAFWAAAQVWPRLHGDLPERLSRKTVCVVQIGVLVVLLMPVVTPPVSTVLAVAAFAAVVWSFARDIRYLTAPR